MMKTFFEDLTKRLGETAELVGNKANEAMEVQRLKNQIRTLERNNEDDLAELGRVLYEKFLNGEELEAEEEALCEAIQDREEVLKNTMSRLLNLEAIQIVQHVARVLRKVWHIVHIAERRFQQMFRQMQIL